MVLTKCVYASVLQIKLNPTLGVQRAPQEADNKKFLEGLEEAVAIIQLYGEKNLFKHYWKHVKKN